MRLVQCDHASECSGDCSGKVAHEEALERCGRGECTRIGAMVECVPVEEEEA